MNRCIQLGALLSVLSLVACGGEGADSVAPDTAKSSKELKDLTADEVQTECTSLASRITLTKEDSCEFAGLMAVAFGQTCEAVKTECVKAPEQGSQGQAQHASCLPPTEQRAGCTATLAEYEVCLIAQTEMIRALTCTSELSTLNTLPPECAAAERKCPRLFGVGEEPGQGGSATP